MRRTLLLWDLDGTLLRTRGAGMRAMASAATRLFGEDFRWDGIDAAGHLDPLIFAEAATLNGLASPEASHAEFRGVYLGELEAELERTRDEIEVLPGVAELLGALSQRSREADDVALGLVTGNYEAAAPLKLRAAGLEPELFTLGAFGDEAADRPGMIALALERYAANHGEPVRPERTVVIGDTPRDVDCALRNGCVAFGVATGRHDAATLRAAGAHHAAESLADPSPLLRLL